MEKRSRVKSGEGSRLSMVRTASKGNFCRALSPHHHRSSAIGYGRNLFRKTWRRSCVGTLNLRFDGAKSSARITPLNHVRQRRRHRPAIIVDFSRIDPRLGGRKTGNKRFNSHQFVYSRSSIRFNNGMLVNHEPRGGGE